MSQTVIGFFDDHSEAQRAVERLQSSGISRDRVDVTRGSSESSGAGYGHLDTSNTNSDRTSGSIDVNPISGRDRDDNSVRRDAEGRTLDANDRNTNKITDFFNNLFGGDKDDDNDDARRYSHVAQRSNSIVTVHAQSKEEAEKAAEILDECGAVDVDERAQQYGYANTNNSTESSDRQNANSNREQLIPVIREDLNVGKRTEERGSVRVRSRIVERPVEEHIRLREEHVDIERTAVNRPASGDELNNFEERDIEITERTEVPVVNKEARVVEEVKVSKEVEEHDETVRETLRNTEVDIDRTGGGTTNRSTDLEDDSDMDDDLTRRDR